MFLNKSKTATLNKYRSNDYYDDVATQTETIRVTPYNTDMSIRFGANTIPEAKGYFIAEVCDAQEGDTLTYENHNYTILQINDRWQFNKIVNLVLIVK